MASRWLNLLLGVALLQGALSFGPIDETDEEWIEYRNLLRNGAYRLSRNTRPDHYQVHLTPHLASGDNQFTFDGEVNITITPLVVVNQIELHCNNLTIETVFVAALNAPNVNIATTANQNFICDEYSTFRINTTPNLALATQYIVRITFNGYLQTNMRGFYRSWYNDAAGTRRWMATTQFQPGHARQAFPCYDEPWYKATFDISITRDIEGFSPTISNMPIASSDDTVGNGKIRENFYRTPRTSTYLLAFIVSDYRQVATNNNDFRPFHIYARENIGNTGAYSLAIGVPLLDVMERYTAYSYYNMDPNMNMKQAAIPDFSAGAMENWGLLTYREALILYDPENTNNFYKQRIANIISHEIAHMWFGNLVTCDWWDNLWLNEGFARFYQYYLTAIVSPEMGFETRFITEQVQVSLLSDSATGAHPLTDPSVSDPSGVSAHFSQITYGKGASVLRMTQHLLGNTTYVNGLRNYLTANAFSTAEPSDLFLALQNAATASGALATYPGVTISQYFSSWTEKSGHPLLTVNVNHQTGIMTVQQSRFFFNENAPASTDLWYIPITWTSGVSPDFEDLKPTQIMTLREATISRGSPGVSSWVIFNKQQSGFYRVNYDDNTWNLITRALRGSDRLAIHEYNRAQIVDDVFLLARPRILTYTQAFNIISFLKFEDQYAPWLAAITGFNFALRRLASDNFALSRLRNEIIDLSTAVVARLGYNETENGGIFMDDLLRMHVMTFLCNVGHQGCITAARASFQTWRNGGRIAPNMRPWVYCNGLRYGNSQDYDFFWNQYLGTDLANEQVVMITAAGCTQDQPSLNRFLANIASGSNDNVIIRAQDYSTAISSAVTSNDNSAMRVFQWLQGNLQRVIDTGILNAMLTSISNRLSTTADVNAMETWLSANQETIGESAYSAGTAGVRNSREILDFYEARVGELNLYFDTGYDNPLEPVTTEPTTIPTVADTTTPTIEPTTTTTADPTTTPETTTTTEAPTTTTTAAPTTTEPTTTPVPDSANIATLSFVTLIVTLVINMA